jgi:hypothetical protein
MTNIIKQFNSIVEDLLRQTTYLIGSKYLYNFKILIQFNSVLPIDKFTSAMLPYKQHIMKKNTDFFMSKDVEFSYNNINYSDIIDLKKIFTNIDEESKENIWEILQALILLCEERSKHIPISQSYW